MHRQVLVVWQRLLLPRYFAVPIQIHDPTLEYFFELSETVHRHEDQVTFQQICDVELLWVFHVDILQVPSRKHEVIVGLEAG